MLDKYYIVLTLSNPSGFRTQNYNSLLQIVKDALENKDEVLAVLESHYCDITEEILDKIRRE